MATNKLASGDNTHSISPRHVTVTKQDQAEDGKQSPRCEDHDTETGNKEVGKVEVTPQMIEDNEAKMKERIAQCKNIIESLKIELNEEKAKLEKQSKQRRSDSPSRSMTSNYQCVSTSNAFLGDLSYTTNMYSECVESKLMCCDENLMEYEKQLKKYQNTLNLAHVEKKNAIRKQMLAKAYRLKLLEVENQCNIELLRVKQSLQCLEPLKMIASKWKTTMDEMYDINSFELMPRYPELNANSSSEIASYELEIKAGTERIENAPQEDSLAQLDF